MTELYNGAKYQTGAVGFSLPPNIGDLYASVRLLKLSGYNLTGAGTVICLSHPLVLSLSLSHTHRYTLTHIFTHIL